MKLFKISNSSNKIWTAESKLFSKAFTYAGIAFSLICIIGFLTALTIDRGGLLKGIAYVDSFDWSIYQNMGAQTAIAQLGRVSMISIFLIVASEFLRLIWTFRIMKASKTFIITTYAIFVVAQGLGFGMLFVIWKASEILIIFGVAGFLFLIMAFIGWKARDLSKMRPFIIGASIGLIVLSFIPMILFFSGIYSEPIIFAYFLLAGILTLAYITFDVWILRKYAESIGAYGSSDMAFRLAAFFGFRLLTDLVNLIWTIARLLLYTRD